ncbi:MAG: DNA polymerase III subunit chi [Gammaproteobacteria bacterium]|nr:DNA polymerase III subunit chi [Gammaproteobacteria bacterium]
MNRADFYQLKSSDPASRYPLLCRLLEKCLAAKQQVYIICRDAAEMSHLDQYIWAFKPDSFMPHVCAGNNNSASARIVLGHPATLKSDQPTHQEICINLSHELAPDQFKRIIQLVVQEEGLMQTARQHYASYSQLGHTMQYHKV